MSPLFLNTPNLDEARAILLETVTSHLQRKRKWKKEDRHPTACELVSTAAVLSGSVSTLAVSWNRRLLSQPSLSHELPTRLCFHSALLVH